MEEQNPISTVYNIFINFFGEENVDLQDKIILVHFPKVTVTNENDRSVDITHLWVKVKLSSDGTIDGAFTMIRSELTDIQFMSGYSHSHIQSISSYNFNRWAEPCLGTGPIRNTIASLSTQFSEDMWNLFCLELSKYVTVESLEGVPYVYLEKIGVRDSDLTERIKFPFKYTIYRPEVNDLDPYIVPFIAFILDKRPFGFNFINGSYGIAMSDEKLFITLSNLYIEYYNSRPPGQKFPKQELFDKGILRRGKYIGTYLYWVYDRRRTMNECRNLIGRELFRFKGKPVTFNIINTLNNVEDDPNLSLFLSTGIVGLIIKKILSTINSKYERSSQETNYSGEALRYL